MEPGAEPGSTERAGPSFRSATTITASRERQSRTMTRPAPLRSPNRHHAIYWPRVTRTSEPCRVAPFRSRRETVQHSVDFPGIGARMGSTEHTNHYYRMHVY